MALNILLAEDERSIAENLIYALDTEGIKSHWVQTGKECEEYYTKHHEDVDLIILDVGLPDLTGFELCKKIRSQSQVPLFFLTARSEEVDRILGLELGADDYIVKPFSPREVCSRIKAFFRRFEAQKPESPSFKVGSFEINEDKFKIYFQESELQLRRYEYFILKMLIERPGQVFSRGQIMQRIWESPDMSMERTIDSHIKSIRKELKRFTSDELIVTNRGLGYSLGEK